MLLSLSRLEPYDPSAPEDLDLLWTFVEVVLSDISDVLRDLAGKGSLVRLDIKAVNATTGFIPAPGAAGSPARRLEEALRGLLDAGVDVAFDYVMLNTYHPAVLGEDGKLRLVDLDEYDLIAMGKADFDSIGEVVKLLSFSPSRLTTFSDILNMALASKAYLDTVSEARRMLRGDEVLDVIPLYAGGDDVAVYGRWSEVARFLDRLYSSVARIASPLTASASMVVDRSHTPILELYDRAVRLLEEHAKKVKASAVISYPSPVLLSINGRPHLVDVVPLHSPKDPRDPWPPGDPASYWGP